MPPRSPSSSPDRDRDRPPPPFVPKAKKLTIAEEVGKKLRRMEGKSLKDFLDIALVEFDIGVSLQVSALRTTLEVSMDELGASCERIEQCVERVLDWKQETTELRVEQALMMKNDEKKEKVLMEEW
jgi:uncharacterized protein YqgV (UPF0045/DUF77 family)